jgi:glycosyltransferase involved in cell wall biosynthesis
MLPERPTVAVVVCTRDRRELLHQALRAIAAQDYPGRVELVVVFDQSDRFDLDLDLADQVNRSVRVLDNQRQPGLAGARNTGIEAAETDLVAFCDDDDQWLPTKLSAQIAALHHHPGHCLVTTGMRVHHEGRELERPAPDRPVTLDELLRTRVAAIHPSSFLFHREALVTEIGLVNERLPGAYGEDYDLMLRAARVAPILSVPDPLVDVYWHQASFFASKWQTIVDAHTYLLENTPEYETDPKAGAWHEGKVAFAHASLGHRDQARRWAVRALRHQPTQKQALVALAASFGLLSPTWVQKLAQRTGRGV